MTVGGFGGNQGGGQSRDSAPPPSVIPPSVAPASGVVDSSARASMIMIPTAPPASPRTLGRYELLVPIAEGGMASVWAARIKSQRGFQKIVAIKQMRPELTQDDNFETMFLDEASLVSRLRHPNLAEILDLGDEDDQLFQVMEFVDGEPLNRLLRQKRGPLPIPLAVLIAKEVCAGLHAAHELLDDKGQLVGLVHRDISLQNILVTYDGVTKVIDFGVAKAVSNQQKTQIGQVKGKVPYMSPEQAVGDPVDRRTDIFALGIVLYQLITGKHPFRGDTELETMMHICDKKPAAPPSTLVKTIPPALEAVVMKALEKNKEVRYGTMAEMLRGLEGALPIDQVAKTTDLASFMKELLGTRGEQRRLAIQEAGRLADLAAPSGPRPATVPPSARLTAASVMAGVPSPHATLPPGSLPPGSVPHTNPALSTQPRGAPAPAPAPKSAWARLMAGSGRTILLIAVMGTAGVGIGLGVVSFLMPSAADTGLSPIMKLYPSLARTKQLAGVLSRVKFAPPPPPAATTAAPKASSAPTKKPKGKTPVKKQPEFMPL